MDISDRCTVRDNNIYGTECLSLERHISIFYDTKITMKINDMRGNSHGIYFRFENMPVRHFLSRSPESTLPAKPIPQTGTQNATSLGVSRRGCCFRQILLGRSLLYLALISFLGV